MKKIIVSKVMVFDYNDNESLAMNREIAKKKFRNSIKKLTVEVKNARQSN